jgi:hypothetical protein
MDTINSAEFRKRYAKLTQPTAVTVLGRVIGTWMPGYQPFDVEVGREALVRDDERFSTRPFTPVPKSTKR